MSNNIIIKGFKATSKLIGKGYATLIKGINVPICKLSTREFICMAHDNRDFIKINHNTRDFICIINSTRSI